LSQQPPTYATLKHKQAKESSKMKKTLKQGAQSVAIAAAIVVAIGACTKKTETSTDATQAQNAGQGSTATSQAPAGDSVKIDEIKAGTGAEATAGKTISVHYTGTLAADGKKFDSSVDRGQPFQFILGAGQVIRGWDMGLMGMKVGGKRKLTIPASLGYGERGAGNVIPPNAILVFEVELLGVK